jgi:hypothetical protein
MPNRAQRREAERLARKAPLNSRASKPRNLP